MAHCRRLPLLSVATLLALGLCGSAQAYLPPLRIVVGYTPAGFVNAGSLESRLRLTRAAAIPQLGVHVLTTDAVGSEAALAALRADPRVRYAELDGVVRALRTPNDALWPTQWSPHKTNAPLAWDLTVGSPAVVVAILDTGVDAAQPDLRGKLVSGYDYVNGDSDPSDDNGHGTAVAGIAGAVSNNRIGVAGYCWECRLMPVKVLDSNGIGFTSTLAQGMVWATDHGARVINVSLGSSTDDLAVASAAQYARVHGVLVVAAAGNNSSPILQYPAALPGVVSVSASDRRDRLYDFSNSGSALAAPGDNSTTSWGGGYESFLGTSSAAPVVSGIAGLGFSADPDASPDEVEEALKAGAVAMPGVTFGRVDAYRTVHLLAPSLAPPAPKSRSLSAGATTVTRRFSGKLGHRTRRFRIVVRRAGLLRATLVLRLRTGRPVELRLRRDGRLVASARGHKSLHLRARVRRGTYRLVLSSSGDSPVRFRLTVVYPRAS
jgi:subtilase family protein/fervidolysin-like protein